MSRPLGMLRCILSTNKNINNKNYNNNSNQKAITFLWNHHHHYHYHYYSTNHSFLKKQQQRAAAAVAISFRFSPSASCSSSSFDRKFFSSDTTNKDDNDDDDDTKNPLRFVSHLKNPIVHQLWTARGHAKKQAAAAKAAKASTESTTTTGADNADDDQQQQQQKEVPLRHPSDSKVSISYPFSTDVFFKETYRNPWGQMRFGKLLEDLDALAGNIAFMHVQDPHMTLVTASVDRIRLSSTPNLEIDQHLTGNVTYVGSSSMEIRIQCSEQQQQQEEEEEEDNKNDDSSQAQSPKKKQQQKYWLEAYFTFVATDPITKRPVKIPPLQPQTRQEIQQFQAGERRAMKKKMARKRSKNNMGNATTSSSGGASSQDDDSSVLSMMKITSTAKALMEEAGPLINMPSLANPHLILIPQTKLANAELAQPQSRNLANQIFGGFLMRRACELAYSTAYVFAGTKPIFYEVDQISFTIPVHVGDLLNFHAKVLHTDIKKGGLPNFNINTNNNNNNLQQQDNNNDSDNDENKTKITNKNDNNNNNNNFNNIPLVSIEVEAWIIDPTKASAKLSNQFYFTFALPAGTQIRRVLPSNMEEAIHVAQRIEAEKQQEQEED